VLPIIASVLIVTFVLNLFLGSLYNAAFLSDVIEMLVLAGIALLFVITILKKEAVAETEK